MKTVLLLLAFFSFSSSRADDPVTTLKTVDYVELSRYAGNWYQIARKPVLFEAGCVCSRQVLTPRSDGKVGVRNTCNFNDVNGRLIGIEGTAENVDAQSNAKFKVDFGLPFKGDYWIIGLADDYSWAIVTDPDNTTLYVLSKTPEMSDEKYNEAVSSAAKQRDVSVLKKTLQSGCSYP